MEHSRAIKSADDAFGRYLKAKCGYRCQRCGYRSYEGDPFLTISHFYSRNDKYLRFDERNCDVFCGRCHESAERNKAKGRWYYRSKTYRLGIKEFDLMTRQKSIFTDYSLADLKKIRKVFLSDKLKLLHAFTP